MPRITRINTNTSLFSLVIISEISGLYFATNYTNTRIPVCFH